MAKLIIALLFLWYNCVIIVNVDGFSCLNVEPVNDFQPEKLSGVWYGFARSANEYDIKYKCNEYNYEYDVPNGLRVLAKEIRISDNTEVTFNSILEYDEDSSIANFTVHVLEKDTKNVYNLMILAIDYDRYHIYYGCNEKKEVEYCWLVTRDRIISNELAEELMSIVHKLGIHKKHLIEINQTDCNN